MVFSDSTGRDMSRILIKVTEIELCWFSAFAQSHMYIIFRTKTISAIYFGFVQFRRFPVDNAYMYKVSF